MPADIKTELVLDEITEEEKKALEIQHCRGAIPKRRPTTVGM